MLSPPTVGSRRDFASGCVCAGACQASDSLSCFKAIRSKEKDSQPFYLPASKFFSSFLVSRPLNGGLSTDERRLNHNECTGTTLDGGGLFSSPRGRIWFSHDFYVSWGRLLPSGICISRSVFFFFCRHSSSGSFCHTRVVTLFRSGPPSSFLSPFFFWQRSWHEESFRSSNSWILPSHTLMHYCIKIAPSFFYSFLRQ